MKFKQLCSNSGHWKRSVSFGIAIFFATQTFGQNNEEELKAQILDSKDSVPIVFATIQFKNTQKGIVTDDNGYFRMPAKLKSSIDTLRIASIGYETLEIPTSNLQNKELNIILLTPKIESLSEVVLVGKGKQRNNDILGISLIKKAIDSIPKNYPNLPHSYVAYYRDYQKTGSQYLNLNEAIIEVFDGGIQTNQIYHPSNQTVLHQYKTNLDFPQDEQLAKAYNADGKYILNAVISDMGGNELSILFLHNPIRNYVRPSFSFVDVLQTDFVGNHTFKTRRVSYFDGVPLYEIDFEYIKPNSAAEYSAKGKVFISPTTYAIYKLEYYLFHRNKPLYTLTTEYISREGLMYLNYISFNNYFKVSDRQNFEIKDITFDINENAFYVSFTNPVKRESLNGPKDFRFLYKKRKLSIADIETVDTKKIKVKLVKGTIPIDEIEDEEGVMRHITHRIRNLRDIQNRKLGKKNTVTANQFRELFVQEVFPIKPLPQNINYVNKQRPLPKYQQANSDFLTDKYWLNTPLKSGIEKE
ncbi:carboxypeptidase-like regulatory domain-containing protein [Flagellimonas meridianipacifica]|uniref:Carboxypeptidase-like protein n=1 Tax=Flagellimonas meridianipacifica TaxID=1080225 RepID=A0A2T0MH06_9FLAO|nr:carboxypeptidase-like regulatory domain-containing protein [Allomuricauda pacifica]PRX56861.1 carboxypeptidase-like protein [Allomuricauda pacifica]